MNAKQVDTGYIIRSIKDRHYVVYVDKEGTLCGPIKAFDRFGEAYNYLNLCLELEPK